MKIKKDDTVLITTGKDKGRKGKVFKVLPKEGKVLIENINLKKKHVRPKKSNEKGQVVKKPGPLDLSNVKLVCPKCNKPTRVLYKVTETKRVGGNPPKADSSTARKKLKTRVCKKCNQEI